VEFNGESLASREDSIRIQRFGPGAFLVSLVPKLMRNTRILAPLGRILLLLAFLAAAVPAAAGPDDDQNPAGADSSPGLLKMAWGTPEPSTLYLGMWTKHFHPGMTNNELVAVNFHGYFAGTFLNSWHDRSYAAGVERSVHHGSMGKAGAYSVGYRLGAINGYDSRLIRGAGSTPVVPFVQVIGNASWKRVGVQGSYCWLVVTGGFFVRL